MKAKILLKLKIFKKYKAELKIKILIIKMIILIYILYNFNNKIKIQSKKYQNILFLKEKKYYLNYFPNITLKEHQSFVNDSLINIEKINFFKFLSRQIGKKVTFVDTIFYTVKRRFGNSLCNLNKLMFYCEIVRCKKIILDKAIYWFINSEIKANNITICADNKYKYFNSTLNLLYLDTNNIYNYFFKIRPEIRINYLKSEIIKNLPKVNISNDSLFVHFRSDDIFTVNQNRWYAQPPLCFYESILNNFKFNNIYIISKDKNNPIIEKLIKYYSNIKYLKNHLKKDISYLINAFNIVASISSFLISIIQLNSNVNNLWDYNIYKVIEKIRHFHYDLYNYPEHKFTIYRMEPSINYKKIMYIWRYKRKTKKLIMKEKCDDFSIIKNK